MPQYKLYYFPLRGRGDAIRYLFSYANQPYQERPITFEEWPEWKQKFPFGSIPVLEVDGKQMYQSVAILRYLANQFNLNAKTDFDKQKCDAYVDGVQELWSKYAPAVLARLLERDEPKSAKLFQTFAEETLKPFLDRYEKFLEQNKTGVLVGNQITWADIVLAEFMARLDECFKKGTYANHKLVEALVRKVHENPGIKKYCSQRPQYPA